MAIAFPVIGHWYRRTNGNLLKIVAVDEEDATIEIQFFDGTIDEVDIDTWNSMLLERVGAPEDCPVQSTWIRKIFSVATVAKSRWVITIPWASWTKESRSSAYRAIRFSRNRTKDQSAPISMLLQAPQADWVPEQPPYRSGLLHSRAATFSPGRVPRRTRHS